MPSPKYEVVTSQCCSFTTANPKPVPNIQSVSVSRSCYRPSYESEKSHGFADCRAEVCVLGTDKMYCVSCWPAAAVADSNKTGFSETQHCILRCHKHLYKSLVVEKHSVHYILRINDKYPILAILNSSQTIHYTAYASSVARTFLCHKLN